MLGTIEAEKAERIAQLSGYAWPSADPKVCILLICFKTYNVQYVLCKNVLYVKNNDLLKTVFPAESGSGAAAKSIAVAV